MNVLLITDSYPPEIRSASHLMQELAEELDSRGYGVTVITTYPEYNLLHSERNKVFRAVSDEDGIRVIRVKTLPLHNVNFILRGLAQLTLPLFFKKGLKKYYPDKVDIAVIYSPPLTLSVVGIYVKKRFGARLILKAFQPTVLHALDLDIKMVLKARAYLDARHKRMIALYLGDVSRLPYRDGSLDALFGFGVLHHIPDWKGGVKEIARVLKPGGLYFLEEIFPPL